jgi:hypothetical protein
MKDEEIGRFASVLEGCGGIRKMMVRDEAALSDGEHDDAPEAGQRRRARRASARRFGEGA